MTSTNTRAKFAALRNVAASASEWSAESARLALAARWLRRAAAVIAAAVLAATPALAVTTAHWDFTQPTDFMQGKLEQLRVASDGTLQLGYARHVVGEFAKEIWCSTVSAEGVAYFGTGSPAKVHALDPHGKLAEIFKSDQIAVTALALAPQGGLYAATMADGKLYRLTGNPGDRPAEFCQLPSPYVWALRVDKQGNLFAGTGPQGKIYQVSPQGRVVEWFDAEDSNILCLAFDATGALLAGGSDRGQLYRITGPKTGTVLQQFEEEEVKAVAVQGDDLYIGVNRLKSRPPRAPLLPLRPGPRQPGAPPAGEPAVGEAAPAAEEPAAERFTPPAARLQNVLAGTLYHRNPSGRVDNWMAWNKESILDLAVEADGGVLVALAGEARVYRVTDRHQWELLFDFEEQQVLTLATHRGHLAVVGTGNVGRVYRLEPEPALTGTFISQVLDGRFRTQWGIASWHDGTGVRVTTRSGNTGLPGTTWSDWSAPSERSPAKITSPPGRYLQVRVELHGRPGAHLRQLSLYYQVQNQRPEVDSIRIDDLEGKATSAAKPKRAEADDKEEEADKPAPASGPALRKKTGPKREIRWQASDKDGDKLVFRLYYQREGDRDWTAVPLDKPLEKAAYTWETDSIPDGWYRIKVVASDEAANPAGSELTGAKQSDPFLVDNRRPEIQQLRYDARTRLVAGRAQDNLGLIASIEYAVDGGEWKAVAAADGVFDEREEAFEFALPDLPRGPHHVAVRATDESGNVGVESLALPGP